MNNLKQYFSQIVSRVKKAIPNYKDYLPYVIVTLSVIFLYVLSEMMNKEDRIYHQKESISFEGGRIIENGKGIYDMKEKVLTRRVNEMESTLKFISESLQKLYDRIEAQDSKKDQESPSSVPSETVEEKTEASPLNSSPSPYEKVVFSDPSDNFQINSVTSPPKRYDQPSPLALTNGLSKSRNLGPSVISFPVQATTPEKEMTVKIPVGSYLKAKLLTGVEASESRPVPVLLQADYFFVGPNKSKVDLSGCFIIAKSQGNLSIERVEMQADKISCVSKSGRMFERELNGFVADGNDSSFGIAGLVNSKQSRVASVAFLSSIVQGIGNAIQQAQTSTQTNALGGTNSVITGEQAQYMAAGGVSNAASLVTNWYLRHAQNLLPTINIGSGQDVWLVLQDTVELPNWYFTRPKNSSSASSFSYLSRLID